MALSAELQDFAERYAAAWSSGNPQSVAAHFEPEGTLTINGGTPATGTAALTAVAAAFMTELPDMKVLCDLLLVRDGATEFHWTLLSESRGIRISGFESWTLGPGGLIAASIGTFDAALYQQQLDQSGHKPPTGS